MTLLVLRSLPWTVGRKEVLTYFSSYGKIANVNIDYTKTGFSSKICSIKFRDDASAIEANKEIHFLDGQRIKSLLRN